MDGSASRELDPRIPETGRRDFWRDCISDAFAIPKRCYPVAAPSARATRRKAGRTEKKRAGGRRRVVQACWPWLESSR